MSINSKGAWGLLVPRQVNRIFTAISISRSSYQKQLGSRYNIMLVINQMTMNFATFEPSVYSCCTLCLQSICFFLFLPKRTVRFERSLNHLFLLTFNLISLALNTCQTFYLIFRFCKVLCFY